MIFCRQEVYTLSEFRDRWRNELVTKARHPSDVYVILEVLKRCLNEKIREAYSADEDGKFIMGLNEAHALIGNLRNDIAHEFGYEEGK